MKSVSYKKNPHTAGRIIDGLAFIVTPNDNKLHTLNATATRLWQLAAEELTAEVAADDLCSRFQVERADALRDAHVCLRDLVARRILVAL